MLIIFMAVSVVSCQKFSSGKSMQTLQGEAFGTAYQIKYFGEIPQLEASVDSIIEAVNQSMSNYREDSDISRINRGDTSVVVDQMFREVFVMSRDIYQNTKGYFDPTVGNIVNAYGLGAQHNAMNSVTEKMDSLRQYVGFDKVELTTEHKIKKDPGIYIDFNAIAKGYAVDRFGLFLEQQGIENYLVEIGGEMRARGKNLSSGHFWRLGIDDPRVEEGQQELQGIFELKDGGMATSGNYRKFRYDSITGQKYVHIIDPLTLRIHKSKILSASVVAEDCATADAYATAFMAMDLEKSKVLSQQLPDLEVFFIYDEGGDLKTYISEGFKKIMVEL